MRLVECPRCGHARSSDLYTPCPRCGHRRIQVLPVVAGFLLSVILFAIGFLLTPRVLPALFHPSPTSIIAAPTWTLISQPPEATLTPTPWSLHPAHTATSAASYETTELSNTTHTNVVGQVDVEYPVYMSPHASDTVFVKISLPPWLIEVNPETITRVPVSLTEAAPMDVWGKYSANILISDTMRVELSSPGLELVALSPAKQQLSGLGGKLAANWAWTIEAPDEPGNQVFVVVIYLKNDSAPTWLGSFLVDVQAPSPTPTTTPTETFMPPPSVTTTSTTTPRPTSTATPSPTATLWANQLLPNFVGGITPTVCLGIPGSLVVLYGLYISIRRLVQRLRRKQVTAKSTQAGHSAGKAAKKPSAKSKRQRPGYTRR